VCLSVPRQVAAGGVMLATLGAGVLRLHFLKQHWNLLGPSVAGEECLVGVGGGLAPVEGVGGEGGISALLSLDLWGERRKGR